MSKLKRYYTEGQVYFVTSVTHQRQPILVENGKLLWQAILQIRDRTHFELLAWVFMPDHIHLLIDPGGNNLSKIMKQIKLSFASKYHRDNDLYRGRVWQPRFWDHVIRDNADLNKHLNYIHYNPVRHGLTSIALDWELSSLKQNVKDGFYTKDWGAIYSLTFEGDFGE